MMPGEAFVDSNVFVRHLMGDNPEQAARATAFFLRISSGALRATTAGSAIMEVVYVLERSYGIPRSDIGQALSQLVALDHLHLPDKAVVLEALDRFVRLNVPYVDALHAAIARTSGSTKIMSFDRHFDRFPEIERIEP